MRSATSRTSRSLWVMKTMAAPDSLSWRMISMSSSVSCGVSTAVGSSKTSTFASRESALMISTRCCTPTGRSSMSASGFDVESEPRRDLAHAPARGIQIEEAPGARRLVAEHHVLGDGEDGDEHEVLVDHADAGAHRVAGTVEVLHLVVEQDHALVGRGRARTGRSSASTCRRRSRRAGSGSRPARPSRSMWSFATRLPNRLVIPRSSSFMLQILVTGRAPAHCGAVGM